MFGFDFHISTWHDATGNFLLLKHASVEEVGVQSNPQIGPAIHKKMMKSC